MKIGDSFRLHPYDDYSKMNDLNTLLSIYNIEGVFNSGTIDNVKCFCPSSRDTSTRMCWETKGGILKVLNGCYFELISIRGPLERVINLKLVI